MCVYIETQKDSVVVLLLNYKMMNNFNTNEIHRNCIKRMDVVVEMYSLETDFGY